jgi:hypothetical protein
MFGTTTTLDHMATLAGGGRACARVGHGYTGSFWSAPFMGFIQARVRNATGTAKRTTTTCPTRHLGKRPT